ncbi:uncharacterized protein LOC143212553 [Lasioglossum baleicum]|uniref:uncharacterized protein LOC143212553 n=1 Tax=Lasioglossum baleicum TaxID=434251 RepID=UPI003FCE060E
MVLVQSTVSSLGAIFIMLLPCSAFTADRSVNVPTGWNIVPLLETEQKVTVDHFSNGRTPVTSLDKLLQPSDTKKSTQSAEQTISQDTERDRRYVEPRDIHFTETLKDATINEESTIADTMVSSPRNAVLLLVAESDHDRKDLWEDIRAWHSFPVEGHLQSCHNTKIETSWFPLDKALVSGSKDTECDCEHYLRSNVATLLLWARDVKGMTTGTLFNSNFTIPSLFGYEEPASVPGVLDELDENMKLNIRKAKPEIHSDWYMIDLGKPVNHALSGSFVPNNREEGTEDPAWNIFDMFSRVRMALFRSLLDALGKNVADSEEPIPFGRFHPSSSNLEDIVRELKSIQNRKGFVLVAATPASELNSAMATLQRELTQDVLVVVAGVCTHDTKPIPFLAKGPAAKMLHEAVTIWDLPTTIRNILTNGYQDPSCRIRRQDTNSLPAQQLTTVPEKEAAPEKILQNIEKTDTNVSSHPAQQVTTVPEKEAAPEKILQNTEKTVRVIDNDTNVSSHPAQQVTTVPEKEAAPEKILQNIEKTDTNVSSHPAQQVTTVPEKEAAPEKILQNIEKTDTNVSSHPAQQVTTVAEKEAASEKILRNNEKTVQVNASNADASTATEEKKDEFKESPSIIKAKKNLASSDTKATKSTMIFGTITSILVTFILAS